MSTNITNQKIIDEARPINNTSSSASQRIDQLMDDRISCIRADITEIKLSSLRIEKMIVGNGSKGLIQHITENSTKIKIIMWVLSIIVGGALGGAALCTNVEVQKKDVVLIEQNQLKPLKPLKPLKLQIRSTTKYYEN